ncbi:MAG TPA: cell division protein FtsL [Candidatus Tectomicrobia bacterium]
MLRQPQAASAPSAMSRGRARRIASRHVGMALLLSAIMVLSGVLLYLWPQVRLVGLSYRYSKLLAQRTQMLHRQKELQVEISSLRQLRRIEDIAAQHLGLRPPQATQVIYVRLGQQAAGQRRQ